MGNVFRPGPRCSGLAGKVTHAAERGLGAEWQEDGGHLLHPARGTWTKPRHSLSLNFPSVKWAGGFFSGEMDSKVGETGQETGLPSWLWAPPRGRGLLGTHTAGPQVAQAALSPTLGLKSAMTSGTPARWEHGTVLHLLSHPRSPTWSEAGGQHPSAAGAQLRSAPSWL